MAYSFNFERRETRCRPGQGSAPYPQTYPQTGCESWAEHDEYVQTSFQVISLCINRLVDTGERTRTTANHGLAEGVGFEPTLRFPVNTLSKRAPSATRPPLRSSIAGDRRRGAKPQAAQTNQDS